MAVRTVTGEISADRLGIVLPHEHAFIDLRKLVPEPQSISGRVLAQEKVHMGNLGVLQRNPYAVLDNALIEDENVIKQELLAFKKAGGSTIVDLTLRDIGRDPILLTGLSRELGLNIVAGCGYYIQASHPPDMEERTVEGIAEEMVAEIRFGMDGTAVKAGVIGEIGTSAVIHPDERKALLAAALAQQETGLGVHVHTDLWARQGLEVMRILTGEGVPPDKICINHVDVDIHLDYLRALLHAGAIIEFDNFGKEFYADRRHRSVLKGLFARDIDRVRTIKLLIDEGFAHQIMISTDVCLKTALRHYGGWGFDHMLTNIVPMLEDEGVTADEIEMLMRVNPARFLDDGRPPQSPAASESAEEARDAIH
ncbi:phosphotriesterase family protein [Paenibacillus agaridevorans]|uniref:phosphotriesterase family protein n=1 Tax=Paenibacillus agaridevorans TaxID=171404 RepID=UPI001BE4558A|nr:hypothetical protein [Paenibacillus agaridevorans]